MRSTCSTGARLRSAPGSGCVAPREGDPHRDARAGIGHPLERDAERRERGPALCELGVRDLGARGTRREMRAQLRHGHVRELGEEASEDMQQLDRGCAIGEPDTNIEGPHGRSLRDSNAIRPWSGASLLDDARAQDRSCSSRRASTLDVASSASSGSSVALSSYRRSPIASGRRSRRSRNTSGRPCSARRAVATSISCAIHVELSYPWLINAMNASQRRSSSAHPSRYHSFQRGSPLDGDRRTSAPRARSASTTGAAKLGSSQNEMKMLGTWRTVAWRRDPGGAEHRRPPSERRAQRDAASATTPRWSGASRAPSVRARSMGCGTPAPSRRPRRRGSRCRRSRRTPDLRAESAPPRGSDPR